MYIEVDAFQQFMVRLLALKSEETQWGRIRLKRLLDIRKYPHFPRGVRLHPDRPRECIVWRRRVVREQVVRGSVEMLSGLRSAGNSVSERCSRN